MPGGGAIRKLLPLVLLLPITLAGLHHNISPGRLQEWTTASDANVLPSQLFLPLSTTSALRPVLIFLHGGGDGPFNVMNRQSLPRLLLSNRTFAATFPFIGIFPCSTCQGRMTFAERGWVPSNFVKVDRLLEAVLKEHSGDPTRVILTGQSMGGGGMYRYAQARRAAPQFAALVPVCAAIRPPSTANDHADLCCSNPTAAAQSGCCPNIWAFHGANDGSVPVSFSDGWVKRLRAQSKQEVRYTRYDWAPPPPMVEYSQMTGHASYEYAYRDPELWSWLLEQRHPSSAELHRRQQGELFVFKFFNGSRGLRSGFEISSFYTQCTAL